MNDRDGRGRQLMKARKFISVTTGKCPEYPGVYHEKAVLSPVGRRHASACGVI
jgi:hypothetical protein